MNWGVERAVEGAGPSLGAGVGYAKEDGFRGL